MCNVKDNFVDIIIPTYNSGNYIISTLKSVLNQTYKKFHIYIVDDGSTDNSVELINSLNSKNITIIRQKNSGPSCARNNGFFQGNGEFVAFLDSDDIWEPSFLEKSLGLLQMRPDLGCVFSEQNTFGENGTIIARWCRNDGRVGRLSSELCDEFGLILIDAWRELLTGTFIHLSATVLRREVVTRVGEFDEFLTNAEDRDFFIRLSIVYHVGFIDQTLAHRRMRHDSLSHDLHKSAKGSDILCRRLLTQKKLPFSQKLTLRKKLSDQWFGSGRDILWKKRSGRDAAAEFLMSFKRYPNLASLIFLFVSLTGIYHFLVKIKKGIKE